MHLKKQNSGHCGEMVQKAHLFERPCAKSAFTMVELLLVIAIICILAALLLPTLAAAKLHIEQARCLGNLRQITLAHHLYVDDFRREIPLLDSGGWINGLWDTKLASYYGNNQSLPFCPSASQRLIAAANLNGFAGRAASSSVGTADTTWRSVGYVVTNGVNMLSTNFSSYGFNAWLCDPQAGFRNVAAFQASAGGRFFRSPSAVHSTSLTPVFADAIVPGVVPKPTDLPAADLYLGRAGLEIRMTIARHGSRPPSAAPRNADIHLRLPGMIDVAFYDGHVEKAPLENLWNYYWSDGWQVPRPRPGLRK